MLQSGARSGTRPQHLVRVLNPGFLQRLLSGREPARPTANERPLEARLGTPKTLAELGGLVEIALDANRVSVKTLRALKARVRIDEFGDKAWAFTPTRTRLVSDSAGDLHVVGFYVKPPDGFAPGRSVFVGQVVAVTYRIDGETKNRMHEFCEHGGDCPKLYFKDGYLLFRGGTYTMTPNGLIG